MEIWKVASVDLLSRPAAGQAVETARLACLTVAWTASNNHGVNGRGSGRQGYLLATGLDIHALQALAWRPAKVRFAARGALEPREFDVDDFAVEDAGQGIVRFTIP